MNILDCETKRIAEAHKHPVRYTLEYVYCDTCEYIVRMADPRVVEAEGD